MTKTAEGNLLTRTETARYINVKVQTLAAWACVRRGPSYVKVGRAVRYRKADLDAWLAANTVTGDRHRGSEANDA